MCQLLCQSFYKIFMHLVGQTLPCKVGGGGGGQQRIKEYICLVVQYESRLVAFLAYNYF